MRNYFKLLKGTSANPVERYYEETYVDYIVLLKLRSHWGMHYPYYDGEHKTLTEGILNLNRVLATKAGIKEGMEILDAGCGVGGSSIWLTQNLKANVTGITIVKQQLERANRLAVEKKLTDKVKFLLRDYTQTGFPDNSFDVVWAIESVCYAQNKNDFLKEAYRILKPGGRVIVADGFQIKENLNDKEDREIQAFANGWAVPRLGNIKDFAHGAEELQFKNVQYENIYDHIWKFSRWLYRWSFIAYPIAKILEITGLRSKNVGVKNVKGAYWQYRTLRKKLWGYIIFQAEK